MVGLRRPGSVSYRPLEVGAPELDDVAGQHAQRDPARHHFRDQLSPDVVAVGVGRAAGPVERLGGSFAGPRWAAPRTHRC